MDQPVIMECHARVLWALLICNQQGHLLIYFHHWEGGCFLWDVVQKPCVRPLVLPTELVIFDMNSLFSFIPR